MTRPEEGTRAGRGPDPDMIRTEAERLVATGLAAVSMAADRIGAPTRERGGAAAASFDALGDMLFGPAGHRRHNVANDSPECCRCPVCRMIAAARQPSPGFAERLASGVGFMAEGAARVMRGVAGARSAATGARPAPSPRPPAPAPDSWQGPDPWAAATTEPPAPAMVATPPPVKKTGAKAAKKAVGAKTVGAKAAKKAVAKKAVAKKAVAKKAVRPRKTTGNADR